MNGQQIFRKVVFLDTMTLHFIRLCLEYAKNNDLQYSKDEQAISELSSRFDKVPGKRLKESLKQGLETVTLLSNNDVQIEYAPVSELEMLTGIAKGDALIKAAKEGGVPSRMWSRFPENEIRERITPAELEAIKDRIYGLDSMLEESGVVVAPSDSKRTNEVNDLAKCIVSLIYMGEIDSIIYASALTAGADYLVTADGYLRETVNLVRNSDDDRYKGISETLKKFICDVTLEKSSVIELPKAFTVTHEGKLKGIDGATFP